MQSVPIDVQIARIAARHYGLITLAQLAALGLGRGAIAHRIKAGRLVPVYYRVYAVGHRRADPAAVAAAVLAGGPGAALSQSSAAFLWGLSNRWQPPPEITVPVKRRPALIRVHTCGTLIAGDIRRHLGIRITSPARTLLDNAPAWTDRQRARAVNDARHGLYMPLSALGELLDRLPHHPGAADLRVFTAQRTGPTRSEFEDRFVEMARRYDFPKFEINVYIGGYLVDIVFPAEKLIVELDGYEFHGNRRSFESDRERDAATLQAGYPTVRVTWERLDASEEREAARLLGILNARRQAKG